MSGVTREVPWPSAPREPGEWTSPGPISPPGNTPLPPLPGPGGVSRPAAVASNPFAGPIGVPPVGPPSGRPAGPSTSPFPGVTGPPVVPVDRAPGVIRVGALVVVIALVAAGAYLVLRGGRQFPSAWDEGVDPIASWVAKERDLDFAHPVEVQFLTEQEYSTASTGGEAVDGGEAETAALDDTAAQFRALGMISGKVDFGEATDTLADAGTLAYYDPGTQKVYVRGTTMTPALRVTLAHELTHVLQDQNFDLERIQDLPDGQASTLRALAEGDAGRIEDRFIEDQLTDAEKTDYQKESSSSGSEATTELENKVPPALTTFFAAPYVLGPQLISYLDANGGNKAIDEALQNPPTEEVLFDPTVNGTDAAKDEPLEVAAPDGAQVIESGEFGATAWYLMLASRLEPTRALAAARGLGSDGYVVYREKDRVCVQAKSKGDTAADALELAGMLEEWVAQSPADTASVKVVDDLIEFQSCDPGEDAPEIGKVTVDLLQLPVARTTLFGQAKDEGVNAKQAACFTDGLLDRVSYQQLVEGYLNTPEAAGLAQDVGTGCR